MSRARTQALATLVALLLFPMAVVAQGAHDIEFHALFPGQQGDGGLDCARGAAVYDPLRAGQTLQLRDATGAGVGFGILEDVVPPSREGMCETRVTFVAVPEAEVYFVMAGDQAITSRDRAELERSGWVTRATFGTRTGQEPPEAVRQADRLPAEAFAAHLAEASETVGGLWTSSSRELDLGEIALAIGKYREIVEFSGQQVAWLDEHPPRDCYSSLHGDFREVMQGSGELADLLARGFGDWDQDLLDQGIAMMADLNGAVPALLGRVDQMVSECGG